MRDLFVHGDQFTDISLTSAQNRLGLPDISLNSRYPAFADIDAMFVTAGTNKLKSDGVISFNIKGHQRDHTNQSVHLM